MRNLCFAVLTMGTFLAGIGLLSADDDAKEAAVKKDRHKYEGTWRVVSLEIQLRQVALEAYFASCLE